MPIQIFFNRTSPENSPVFNEKSRKATMELFSKRAALLKKHGIKELGSWAVPAEHLIIIVDEAQNLSDGCLEELRLLSNLETEKEKLLQIILVGQPELQRRLHSEGLRQLDQRISIRATLRPITALETSDYITFRLIKAGNGSAIFDEKAKKLTHKLSGGVPRLINLTASRAMMIAYIGSSHRIRKRHILDTAKHIPDTQSKTDSQYRIYGYAAIAVVVIITVSALLINYVTLQQSGDSFQTLLKSYIHKDDQKVMFETSNPLPSVKPERLIEHERIATVTVLAARLREWPSLQADIADVASKGDSFEVTDEWTELGGNKWYKVRIPDGIEYWMASYTVSVSSLRQLH